MKRSMKIGIFLLLAIISGNILAEDHEYIPLLDDDHVWSYCDVLTGRPSTRSFRYNIYYYQLELSGDTVINNRTYKRVTKKKCGNQKTSYTGAMREENQKVYIILPNEEDEILGYDFTLEEGDIFYSEINEIHVEVTEVKYVEINGMQRKLISFYGGEPIWIEGIGSIADPITYPMFGRFPIDLGYNFLNYQKKNGEITYRTEEFYFNGEDCPPDHLVSIENVKENSGYSIQNNFSDKRQLTILFSDESFDRIELFDLSGRMLHSRTINGELSVDLDMTAVVSGMYFLILTKGQEKIVEKIII